MNLDTAQQKNRLFRKINKVTPLDIEIKIAFMKINKQFYLYNILDYVF
jgi:hypothetical protein